MNARTARLKNWTTPVSDYPVRKLGRAAIKRTWRKAGTALYVEGVRGLLAAVFETRAPCIELRIGGKTWMTDDPAYVWSLESFAERASGRVVVAGLGLGIVAHQLVRNPAVTQVDVVEREPDVIRLIAPLIPHDSRVRIIASDFWTFAENDVLPADTVIWDLGLWTDSRAALLQLFGVRARLLHAYGSQCQAFIHGVDRDPEGEAFVRTPEFLSWKTQFG